MIIIIKVLRNVFFLIPTVAILFMFPLLAISDLAFNEVKLDGGAIDGLSNVRSVTVSPDGNHVYATGVNDDAVSIFSRDNVTGILTYEGLKQNGIDDVPDGLDYVNSVSVSPDGKHVYTAARTDDAVTVFERDKATGLLTYVNRYVDDVALGLNGAFTVTVSHDGRHVYAGSDSDDAVTVFSRNVSSGELTHAQTLFDEDSGSGIEGLNNVYSIIVSPNGSHVYVAGYNDDTLVVFSRNPPTGILTFVERHVDDGNGGAIPGLNGIYSVAISADGQNVYTAARSDDAITVFSRSNSTGALTLVETHIGVTEGGAVTGLDYVKSVVASPDGNYVYAFGMTDDSVVVFTRDRSDGTLSYEERHVDDTSGVDGLDGVWFGAVSPYGNNLYAAGSLDNAIAVFDDLTPPEILSTDPVDGATDVLADSAISATFFEPMDTSTITGSSFTVYNGGDQVAGTISFSSSDRVATFTPSENMDFDTEFTVTLSSTIKDKALNSTGSDYNWSFTTQMENIAPEINSTNPLDGEADVSVTNTISVTFSEEMDLSTIDTDSFTLSDGTSDVAGTISFNSEKTVATFTLAEALSNTTVYTASISMSVTDVVGNPLAVSYEWSFTSGTEKIPPEVISTDPLNGGTDVSVTGTISVTFSEEMDSSTVDTDAFTLSDGASPVAGTISFNSEKTVAMFTPTEALTNTTAYTASVSTSVTDSVGNALEEKYEWSFTSGTEKIPPEIISTAPLNGAVNVSATGTISVIFSEEMDSSTVNTDSFLISDGTTSVAGTISFNSEKTLVTFTPTEALDNRSVYTVNFSTSVKDSAGNPIEERYEWSFTVNEDFDSGEEKCFVNSII